MWTADFDRFVAPARRAPQLWRLILAILAAAGIYAGVLFGLYVGALAVLGGGVDLDGADVAAAGLGATPGTALVQLCLVALVAPCAALAARTLQRRPPASLAGGPLTAPFVGAAVIGLGIAALSMLALPLGVPLVANVAPGAFMALLPLALLALALQTGAEEVVFRGWLQTQLAARFASPWVWMGVPSILFGLAHFDPIGAGDNAWWLVAATGLFGLLAADLTRVTGSIGAAWGFHFANNVVAILVVSLDGPLSGLALWRLPLAATDTETLRPLIAQDMLLTIIAWASVRLWLARRSTLRAGRGP